MIFLSFLAIISLWRKADVITIWKKVRHKMVIKLLKRFSCMKYLFYFLHFFISFKHDFHVDAVRMIVRMYDI